jgi:DNA repair protein RadA/Sms
MTDRDRERRERQERQHIPTYVCKGVACGTLIPQDRSRCPKCGHNNVPDALAGDGEEETVLLSDARLSTVERIKTGMLDPVFGGGLARTSVNMVAGPPGAGKTTLFLQLADIIAEQLNKECLYIANEQHPEEIKETAQRIHVKHMNMIRIVRAMGGLRSDVHALIMHHKPGLIILDSLTALTEDEAMMLRVLDAFKFFTLQTRSPCLIVNQINKGGDQVGIMKLQHKVDATYFLEKDDETGEREFYVTKNRFGEAPKFVRLLMTPSDAKIPGRLVLAPTDESNEEEEEEDGEE